MPLVIRERIDANGGYLETVVSVIPDFKDAGYVIRGSTSSHIFRTDTSEKPKGSDGLHAYFLFVDGTDIVRALYAAHERMWLNGYGYYVISKDGKFLERSPG